MGDPAVFTRPLAKFTVSFIVAVSAVFVTTYYASFRRRRGARFAPNLTVRENPATPSDGFS